MDFSLQVANSTPIAVQAVDRQISVTESGSLQGLTISLPPLVELKGAVQPVSGESVAGELEIATLGADQVPTPPEGVQVLTDFFKVTPVRGNNGNITISFPKLNVPEDRYSFKMVLYVYTKIISNGTGGHQYVWNPTQYKLETLDDGTVTMKTHGLGDACFIGLPQFKDTSNDQTSRSDATNQAVGDVTVNCRTKIYLNVIPVFPYVLPVPWPSHQVCTVEGDSDFELLVKNFNDNNWTPETSIEELVSWVYQAPDGFDDLDLSYDSKLEAQIHEIDSLGYVTTADDENYGVLHLSDSNNNKNLMQATSVHEYFHQAQNRTKVAGLTNILGLPDTLWLTEGTAQWFEDYLFDDIDSYIFTERNPLYVIMDVGFNSPHPENAFGTNKKVPTPDLPCGSLLRVSAVAFF